MKRRYAVAAGFAAALAVAALVAAGVSSQAQGKPAAETLTVWLMEDARENWPGIVAAATRTFESRHSDVNVEVQYQSWGNILTKLDASLAARNAPDVVELGNTQTTKYMAAGAFTALDPKRYPNYKTWIPGLRASCRFNNRTYCVPYYAGSRAVIYRKDMYRAAGVKSVPKSLSAFTAAGRKLMKRYGRDRSFSALYFPGKYWYAGMSFVYDYGGRIATFRNGRWQGALTSPQALRGLTTFKTVVRSLSRASKTGDENTPAQALVFSKGKVASFIGNGWEWPYALNPKDGNPRLARSMAAYPMPSHTKGRYMPSFLGGSNLAIPVTSTQKGLARDWIIAFTNTQSMTRLATQGKVIPNTTKLARVNRNNPQLAPFAEAARYSWFVPTSPNWANVESRNVLQNMLVRIVTGRASVRSAARSASSQITSILNARS